MMVLLQLYWIVMSCRGERIDFSKQVYRYAAGLTSFVCSLPWRSPYAFAKELHSLWTGERSSFVFVVILKGTPIAHRVILSLLLLFLIDLQAW